MSDGLIRVEGGKEYLTELVRHPHVTEAEALAASFSAVCEIHSDTDEALAVDAIVKIRRGEKRIEDGLKEGFAPLKAFEKMVREWAREKKLGPLAAVREKIDAEIRRHRDERERQRAEALAKAQRDAEAAAAAADGNPLLADDDPPPPAEIAAPKDEHMFGGLKEGNVRTASSVAFEKRTLACEVDDLVAIAKSRPHLLSFNKAEALREFRSHAERTGGDKFPEQPVVIDGMRFTTIVERNYRGL